MTDYDEGGEFDGTQDEPRYLLLAREAEMYQEGGYNLTADPQRAGLTLQYLMQILSLSPPEPLIPSISLQVTCLQKQQKLPWPP